MPNETRDARTSSPKSPLQSTGTHDLATALVGDHVAPAPVRHLADPHMRAQAAKAAALVQGDRSRVLGKYACLQSPEPGALGRCHQLSQQRPANAATDTRGIDV